SQSKCNSTAANLITVALGVLGTTQLNPTPTIAEL
ncbi:hypothetical protein CEXT_369141, partial [Caerostris extrusa]